MTSQILCIYYLNDLDHFIKEILNIKYYVRYQDDFLLMYHNKEYLKDCLNNIKEYLIKDKLILNNKTRIYKNTNNFIFLGRNKYNNYSKYRSINRNIKYKRYLYEMNIINIYSYISSINSYKSNYERNMI